ncbi:hypothetical protein NQ314_019158 [Rhamnusium bicolor]|uniref:Uncharacterized protein n=1 Tax=Rhamnusium bicolor TaxID=1586634 RepID=A0AAV8WNV2_9CUCU|nr:hypothetical protein NQ314_019158 [Rhamnusium bicolor]
MKKIPPKDKVSCKCYYQCKALSPEVKTTLFRQFYETDEATQGTFLMGILQVGNIRRRRHGSYDHPENSKRQVSVYYTVPNGSGKHVQYTEEHSHLIHEHINSFPRSESHYCRKKSTKEYLSPDLNINRLYRAFIQKYPNTNISSKHYRKIFKKDFPHLSFKHPRQDTCKTCDLLNCKVKSGENGAKMKLELHHRKVESALSYMKHDHTISQQVNSETCTIFIDLQQKEDGTPKLHGPLSTPSTGFVAKQCPTAEVKDSKIGTHSPFSFLCFGFHFIPTSWSG